MWSLGVVMFILCCGKYPQFYYPPGHDTHNTDKTRTGQYSLVDKVWKKFSLESKELLNKLLETDPERRININEALNSEWIILNSK
jgi:serine/threonine protein kinase